jgi:hypothetical protein
MNIGCEFINEILRRVLWLLYSLCDFCILILQAKNDILKKNGNLMNDIHNFQK